MRELCPPMFMRLIEVLERQTKCLIFIRSNSVSLYMVQCTIFAKLLYTSTYFSRLFPVRKCLYKIPDFFPTFTDRGNPVLETFGFIKLKNVRVFPNLQKIRTIIETCSTVLVAKTSCSFLICNFAFLIYLFDLQTVKALKQSLALYYIIYCINIIFIFCLFIYLLFY